MTSLERFRTVMRYILPDRLPVDFLWVRTETIRALFNHFGTENIEEVKENLGVDFRWVPMVGRFPDFEKRCNGVLEGDAPGAGNTYIFHNRDTFEDEWGIVQRVGSDGKYLQWRDGPLVDMETLNDWDVPEMVLPSIEEQKIVRMRYPNKVIVGEVNNPFKIAWHIAGFEHLMIMMALKPSWVDALFDRLFEFETRRALCLAKAGADIVAIVGDIAGNNGPFFSAIMMEKYLKTRFSKMIAEIKKANPRTYVLFHSDGEMKSMIPILVECGFDILNPIESNCMDPAEIKKEEFGDKIVFHGAISVQKTIPSGSVADVKKEVYTRIRTVGYNGGYIVSNENSFPYDAPLQNVLAMYEAVKDFDYDSLR